MGKPLLLSYKRLLYFFKLYSVVQNGTILRDTIFCHQMFYMCNRFCTFSLIEIQQHPICYLCNLLAAQNSLVEVAVTTDLKAIGGLTYASKHKAKAPT